VRVHAPQRGADPLWAFALLFPAGPGRLLVARAIGAHPVWGHLSHLLHFRPAFWICEGLAGGWPRTGPCAESSQRDTLRPGVVRMVRDGSRTMRALAGTLDHLPLHHAQTWTGPSEAGPGGRGRSGPQPRDTASRTGIPSPTTGIGPGKPS